MIEIRKGHSSKLDFVYAIYDKKEKIWYWFKFSKKTKELVDFALYQNTYSDTIGHNPLVKETIRPLIKGIFKANYGNVEIWYENKSI